MWLIELSQLTLLNALAIAAFSLAMLFHVIAYTTDHWCTFNYEGVQWNMGLWRGCWRNETTQFCTTDIFNAKWFTSGKSSHWSQGTSAMMTISLVCLFLLELAIICYACVKQLERFRDRIVGAVLALSCAAGGFSMIGMIFAGTELTKLSDSLNVRLSWSFGFEVFSLLLIILTGSLVCADMWKYKSSIRQSIEIKASRSAKGIYAAEKSTKVVDTLKDDDEQKHGKLKITYGPYKTEESSFTYQTVSMDTTSAYLPEFTRRLSFNGSLEDSSLHTPSTEIIAVSYERYGPCFEEGSIESLV